MAILGSLIEQVRGVSYKPEDLHTTLNKNSITLLRANNIKDGQLNFDDVVYVDRKKVTDKQLLKAGDILICASSGSKELVGKAAYVASDLQMTFGAFCKVVRPRIECSRYVGHFFNSPYYRERITNSAAGANINNIRNEHIDVLEIAWPSVEEQRSAVTVLDKVIELISLRKEQLAALDQLVKSRFIELFGSIKNNHQRYPVVKIGSCAKLQGGFAFKSSDYLNDGIRLVQISNVNKDTLDWDSINCVPQAFLQKYKDFELHVGELVLAMTRPVIKSLDAVKIATVSENDVPSLLNQRVGRFVVDRKKLHSVYLMVLCQMPEFREYVEAMSGNSLQPNISSKQVEDYSIVLPPLALQEQFAAFVQQTDKSKLAIQRSLDELETLKKALMQKYFG